MSSSHNLNIAVVDDDEALCRSLGRLLRAAGMQAVTYASAEAFLADDRQPCFGCLVLDVQLGGISGLELQRRLVKAGNRTPVVFITAHDGPKIREEATAAGCSAFFRKTDSGADVLQAIRRLTVRERAN